MRASKWPWSVNCALCALQMPQSLRTRASTKTRHACDFNELCYYHLYTARLLSSPCQGVLKHLVVEGLLDRDMGVAVIKKLLRWVALDWKAGAVARGCSFA